MALPTKESVGASKMRLVISGGAGFLGSHLCDYFIERGDEVICVDNLSTGVRANVAHLLDLPNFCFQQSDVTTFIAIDGVVDVVMHFASPASPNDYIKMPIQTLKVGSLGTHNALGLAKSKGAKFLLASTSEVYGDPLVYPQDEKYWGNVNPIGPRGVYDEAKRFAEAITMAYHRYHKLDTRIARIFNTYGPRMRQNDGRVVSNFVVAALTGQPLTIYGDGTQTRSFCFVDDQINGLAALLESSETKPINIGNPEECSIVELAQIVSEVTGTVLPFSYQPLPTDDPRRRRPDISRAQRQLGWQPTINLRKGIERTVTHFQHLDTAGFR